MTSATRRCTDRTRRAVIGAIGLLPLAARLPAARAATPATTAEVRLGGTGAAMGVMQRLVEALHARDPACSLRVLPSLGSGGGLNALRRDAVGIAIIGRRLDAQDRAAGLQAWHYGRTALVLAHARGPGQGLSSAQIADIYAGLQTRWPDGSPIRLVLRPPTDIDTMTLAGLSPGVAIALQQATARPGMLTALTDQEAADAIARLPGALGVTTLAVIASEGRPLSGFTIDGVEPTLANLASGRYPHGRDLFLAIRQGPNDTVRRFVDFVGSAEGQRILAESGHLSTGPAPRGFGEPGYVEPGRDAPAAGADPRASDPRASDLAAGVPRTAAAGPPR